MRNHRAVSFREYSSVNSSQSLRANASDHIANAPPHYICRVHDASPRDARDCRNGVPPALPAPKRALRRIRIRRPILSSELCPPRARSIRDCTGTMTRSRARINASSTDPLSASISRLSRVGNAKMRSLLKPSRSVLARSNHSAWVISEPSEATCCSVSTPKMKKCVSNRFGMNSGVIQFANGTGSLPPLRRRRADPSLRTFPESRLSVERAVRLTHRANHPRGSCHRPSSSCGSTFPPGNTSAPAANAIFSFRLTIKT